MPVFTTRGRFHQNVNKFVQKSVLMNIIVYGGLIFLHFAAFYIPCMNYIEMTQNGGGGNQNGGRIA